MHTLAVRRALATRPLAGYTGGRSKTCPFVPNVATASERGAAGIADVPFMLDAAVSSRLVTIGLLTVDTDAPNGLRSRPSDLR